ncbi:MAG TPA: glycine--tRNA ligase [Candidatus Enterousia intestinigallinarum]|uniref:Glycine--tRNA ligase n=1 Tax=Candidatus Enterousia intestinigallinarum TaxID=2840790 RepID=A0A9D1FFW4_9PROT|nr:glycine--tRNA ligase [Candidatus Enterousia intestinigallinarum]
MPAKTVNDIVALCKRRGFIFTGSEIYGGLGGAYDYGPYGVELMRNIRNAWWNAMVYSRNDIEGLDAALISNRLMWKYSGHEASFSDPLVECKKCGARMRQDKMRDQTKCDNCGSTDLTPPRAYQLMMGLSIGATADGAINAYLRPETATTTYVNFKNVLDARPHKLPFGIAQIGKAFRNEISPRGFVFRMREFEQAEMQYFVNPADDEKYFEMWKKIRMDWWINTLGIPAEKLRFTPHEKLAHYAKAAGDIEYEFPDGFDEVEGIHNRQDFDLGSHTKSQDEFKIQAHVLENKDSTTKLAYSDAQTGDSFIPFVIETAMGVNRAMLAVMLDAYTEEDLPDGKSRVVLKLKPALAPVKAAVIPLARNIPELLTIANNIENDLRKLNIGRIELENSGNIGKNYRRHDEIGTPVCITVDHQTMEDNTVTLRYRDSMAQERVAISDVPQRVMEIITKNEK